MTRTAEDPDLENISIQLTKLQTALSQKRSHQYCLHLWSKFIRERDGYRCVDCHSPKYLSAHHICRKSFIESAQFQSGNGITLCKSCHREVHQGFNGRSNLSMPVDAQGGEKLASMERLYCILTDDAVERNLMHEEFYFLSDELLASFKRMQGFAPLTHFPGARIEQAYLILAECELATRRVIAEVNGVQFINKPLLPGGLYLGLSDEHGQPSKSVVIQTYVPRTKLMQS